jgi:hypothetical protein
MQTFGPYSLCAVVQCPDGVVQVYPISKCVPKCWTLRDRGCDRRLEEVHGYNIDFCAAVKWWVYYPRLWTFLRPDALAPLDWVPGSRSCLIARDSVCTLHHARANSALHFHFHIQPANSRTPLPLTSTTCIAEIGFAWPHLSYDLSLMLRGSGTCPRRVLVHKGNREIGLCFVRDFLGLPSNT